MPQAEKYHENYFATPDLVKRRLFLVRCCVSPTQPSQQMELRLALGASAGGELTEHTDFMSPLEL